MTKAPRSFPHPVYEQVVLQPYFRDAVKYYFGPILAANKAHAVMLYKAGIIERENATALLRVLKDIEENDSAATAYQSGVEDLFFAIENRLIDAAGPAYGGNIQLGRSRNDLGYALTRLAIRPLQLDAISCLLDFRSTSPHFRAPASPHGDAGIYAHPTRSTYHDGSLYGGRAFLSGARYKAIVVCLRNQQPESAGSGGFYRHRFSGGSGHERHAAWLRWRHAQHI